MTGVETDLEEKAEPKRAVVLLSGGLDSATTLAIARAEGFRCHALSFDYQQRHQVELAAARQVAEHLGVVEHRWIRIDPAAFAAPPGDTASDFHGSALTGDCPVPKDRDPHAMGDGIPVTYVPARNAIFLAFATAVAEVVGALDIFLGINAVDYSGYPDCRPEFVEAFETMANLSTAAGVSGRRLAVHAPLITWAKTRIIEKGLALGVDYGLTHSCYDPLAEGRPCRRCDACQLRQDAFKALGRVDPLICNTRGNAADGTACR